jgi:nitrate reductase molybdenum cofactor assembly chaperone NarJ/NarW
MEYRDPYQLQEDYVACFDRGRATSLHLFEHVHGDSRDRGQAMIDLRDQYLQAGLAINPGELPDYLPAFLEYVAHLPKKDAIAQLRDVLHLLQGIHAALVRRRSLYAAALAALIVLAGGKPGMPARESKPQPEPTQEEIDAEWEEQPAFGAARPGACGTGASLTGGVQPVHFMPKSASWQPGAAQ